MAEKKIVTLVCAGCTAPLSEAIVTTGVHRCPFCGYVNILPKEEQSSEVMHYLYSGDAELKDYDFERAYNAYSKAAELDEKESKAYFGMALAANRIKYIKDIVNNRWQAICCEVTDKKFAEDKNYLRALEIATPEQKEEYTARAKEIDYIREKFAELEASGLDYDTFICVKVSDGQGGFTQDTVWANRLYDSISQSGAKPFYSEKEIGSRVGADYEALILYALHKSESMIIVCSDEEYLRTPWIQNEYTRYYAMMNEQEKLKNSIMIAFTGHPVERIPGIPGRIQGADLHDYASSQKINDFVNKFANAEERARKKAEEKSKREAERKAKEEADEKARLIIQTELENLKKQLQDGKNADDSAVKYCTKCGTKSPLNVKFCSNCGNTEFSNTNEKICLYCGTAFPISTKFCTICGGEKTVSSREEYKQYLDERKRSEERRIREEIEAMAREREKKVAAEKAEKKVSQNNTKKSKKVANANRGFWGPLITTYVIGALVMSLVLIFSKEMLGLLPVVYLCIIYLIVRKVKKTKAAKLLANIVYEDVDGGCAVKGILVDTKKIVIPPVYNGKKVVAIGNRAFASCSLLEEVIIPDSVVSIGAFAFEDCKSLKYITIPETVKSIDFYAFNCCNSLESIELPNGLVSIGKYAFGHCKSLRFITIPNSVVSIQAYAFYDCSLLNIRCQAPIKPHSWDNYWNPDNCPVLWGYKE